ncbi:MAG TPA: 16S rRNA (guanine(527)-N(7))-methyltransferase RsmG [Terriglobales bacterium]
MLNAEDIVERLRPFLPEDAFQADISLVSNISTYIDILERWNLRTNLTAIRDPREMLTRHFGESLFAAKQLLERESKIDVVDLGSGAGFPGLPLKLWAPGIRVTLIESQNKKATFLREVVRALALKDVEVFCGRGEQYAGKADLVTMRAVEKFEDALQVAAGLAIETGRLGVLIGTAQVQRAGSILNGFRCETMPMPSGAASGRVLLMAQREPVR